MTHPNFRCFDSKRKTILLKSDVLLTSRKFVNLNHSHKYGEIGEKNYEEETAYFVSKVQRFSRKLPDIPFLNYEYETI